MTWTHATIGDFVTLQRGFDITRSQQSNGIYPVISSSGIQSFHNQSAAHGPGVVIGRKGTLGTVFYSSGDYWPHDTTLWVKDFKGNHPRFAYYFFKTLDVSWMDVGSANPTLNRNHVHPIAAKWPNVVEQRAIAEVLGALDDKIAANAKLAATSESMIFTTYRSSIRDEATLVPLTKELRVDYGEAFKGEYFKDEGVGRPLIRIRDLQTMSPKVWTTESRAREVQVQPGDVLVGMDGEFRAYPWTGVPGLLNQRVCRIQHESLGSAIAWVMLKEPLAAIEREKVATTVIHLNKSDLERATVKVPTETRLRTLHSTTSPLLERIVAAEQESRTLAATRDALLPQLMSGKLRVRDAERVVSDAV